MAKQRTIGWASRAVMVTALAVAAPPAAAQQQTYPALRTQIPVPQGGQPGIGLPPQGGGYGQAPAQGGGFGQPPQGGGYGQAPPQGGGFGQPAQGGGFGQPAQGGFGAPPPLPGRAPSPFGQTQGGGQPGSGQMGVPPSGPPGPGQHGYVGPGPMGGPAPPQGGFGQPPQGGFGQPPQGGFGQPGQPGQRAAPGPQDRLAELAESERRDLGVRPTRKLHAGQMHGPTPNQIPGGQLVTTQGLLGLFRQSETPYLVFDVLGGPDRLPKAIPAVRAASPGTFKDQVQQQFGQFLKGQTRGNRETPLVFYCLSVECWMSYNAALRAINLGYKNVLWYRGGIEAWRQAGLPTEQAGQQ